MKSAWGLLMLGLLALVASCGASPPEGVRVRELEGPDGPWVTPESCTRGAVSGQPGWLVTEQGCGFAQPCKADKANKMGSVVFVPDGQPPVTLLNGLSDPKGVSQDADGNVWVTQNGGVVTYTPSGKVVYTTIDGSEFPNDTAPAPFWGSATWISDPHTGVVYLAVLGDGKVGYGPYATLHDAPNGLVASVDGNGLATATLGDYKLPGNPGAVRTVAPALGYDDSCGDWHGGAQERLHQSKSLKYDGIAQIRHGGELGYVVSSVWDIEKGANDTTLWWVSPSGGTPELLYDVGQHGMVSAADIGTDLSSGTICVPDLNGSKGLTENGAGEAKVLVIEGVQ